MYAHPRCTMNNELCLVWSNTASFLPSVHRPLTLFFVAFSQEGGGVPTTGDSHVVHTSQPPQGVWVVSTQSDGPQTRQQ